MNFVAAVSKNKSNFVILDQIPSIDVLHSQKSPFRVQNVFCPKGANFPLKKQLQTNFKR